MNILPLTVIIVSWMVVILNWLIKHIAQIPPEEKGTGEKFWKCSSFWVKHLKLTVTFVRFYIFFRDRSLVCIKCILLSLSCVFCKEFAFCTLGCSINLFDGDWGRSWVENINRFSIQVDCLVSMRGDIFWTSSNIEWMFWFSFK